MVYIFLFFIMVIIDQYTKFIINTNLSVGETIPIIDDFFHLTYVENRGIAFGLFQGTIDIVSIIAIVIVIGIIFYLFKNYKNINVVERVSCVMIISGAVGNLIDRFMRGFVIDMLDFRAIWSFVFNFADVWITMGIIISILDNLIVGYLERESKNN